MKTFQKLFGVFFLSLFVPVQAQAQNLPGEVRDEFKIVQQNPLLPISDGDYFGASVAPIHLLNHQMVRYWAVGAHFDSTVDHQAGAVWILNLTATGSLIQAHRIIPTGVGWKDHFGSSLCNLGDLDGDGNEDLAVGAVLDDDGTGNAGAVYILFLDAQGLLKSFQKISQTSGGFQGTLGDDDHFGKSLALLQGFPASAPPKLAVGTWQDELGGSVTNNYGAIYILDLSPTGTVLQTTKIDASTTCLAGSIQPGDHFGGAVASLGDLDFDGFPEIAVGAPSTQINQVATGAIWILSLDPVTNLPVSCQQIAGGVGGFQGQLSSMDNLGLSLIALPDLNGDCVTDLAAGTEDNGTSSNEGAVWILFLNPGKQVAGHQKIGSQDGNFQGPLSAHDCFGSSLAYVGDLEGDGYPNLAVGTPRDDTGGSGSTSEIGAVYGLNLEQVPPTELCLQPPWPGIANQVNRMVAYGATPNGIVLFLWGLRSGTSTAPGCPGLTVDITHPNNAGFLNADSEGIVRLERLVPAGASGRKIFLQAVDQSHCLISNLIVQQFQ
ncbi:MAG: hypothetical protein DWQ01_22705 [Planctomycetota bacterium]|nr:MAG: hypothetical protein DWQ01_22705 [Planctomycetota bacterium]